MKTGELKDRRRIIRVVARDVSETNYLDCKMAHFHVPAEMRGYGVKMACPELYANQRR